VQTLFFPGLSEKIPYQPCDDENGKNICTWDQLKQGYYSNPSEHSKANNDSNYVKEIAYYRKKQNRNHIFNDV